jgi:predicted O-linked N-acetylglucosamine transferase (SPINDLY family)
VADAIKEDAIDILVDLTQHLAGNRLPVFSHCPSPVQMSFAGYPESTGLTSIGYRISDCFLESKSATHRIGTATSSDPDLLPEERILLLDSFWCYDPCGATIAANEPPAQTCGQVTFGSLNAFCKMNEDTLQLWSDVLTHTGNSRLVILTPEGSHRERVLDTFHRRGISPNRIQFEAWRTRLEYLELYHELDIILDSYPYNGHTTNLDALWMGVPVVTKAGPRAISRAGLSQLSHLELEDLVAYSDSEYVQIAGRIAGDLSRLASLRINLRRMMQGSILMNGHNFSRGVEAAYRTAWRHWCAGSE